MFKQLAMVSVAAAMLATSPAQARDTLLKLKIQDGLNTPDAQSMVDRTVRMYWGDGAYPTPSKTFGVFTANKKTNSFGRPDEEVCMRAFLDAVISLQGRAKTEGGNAVVNIHSYYRKRDFASETEFECGAGGFIAGATLRGTVVTLP